MKRVILSLLAATAMTAAAAAADLPSRRQAPPAYIPPVFTWTGFYVGLNAGYAWNGDSSVKNANYILDGVAYGVGTGHFANGNNSDDGAFVGGAQIGYNYQMGSVVIGIEADINYTDIKKDYYAYSTYANSASLYDDFRVKSKTEWYGTVRPRIGFTPIDRLLVYVTGGLAYGQVKTSGAYNNYTFDGYWFGGNKDDTRVGWTLGAGAEYAVTNNLTVRAEYAYVDLGDKTHTTPGYYLNEALTWKDQTNFHTVRAGVNYKF